MKTLIIEPGSPWENGYVESFNGKLRDNPLEREAFDTLLEAKVLIERWRQHDNTIRPHSALGYRPPGPRGAAALCGLLEGKHLTSKPASFMGAGHIPKCSLSKCSRGSGAGQPAVEILRHRMAELLAEAAHASWNSI